MISNGFQRRCEEGGPQDGITAKLWCLNEDERRGELRSPPLWKTKIDIAELDARIKHIENQKGICERRDQRLSEISHILRKGDCKARDIRHMVGSNAMQLMFQNSETESPTNIWNRQIAEFLAQHTESSPGSKPSARELQLNSNATNVSGETKKSDKGNHEKQHLVPAEAVNHFMDHLLSRAAKAEGIALGLRVALEAEDGHNMDNILSVQCAKAFVSLCEQLSSNCMDDYEASVISSIETSSARECETKLRSDLQEKHAMWQQAARNEQNLSTEEIQECNEVRKARYRSEALQAAVDDWRSRALEAEDLVETVSVELHMALEESNARVWRLDSELSECQQGVLKADLAIEDFKREFATCSGLEHRQSMELTAARKAAERLHADEARLDRTIKQLSEEVDSKVQMLQEQTDSEIAIRAGFMEASQKLDRQEKEMHAKLIVSEAVANASTERSAEINAALADVKIKHEEDCACKQQFEKKANICEQQMQELHQELGVARNNLAEERARGAHEDEMSRQLKLEVRDSEERLRLRQDQLVLSEVSMKWHKTVHEEQMSASHAVKEELHSELQAARSDRDPAFGTSESFGHLPQLLLEERNAVHELRAELHRQVAVSPVRDETQALREEYKEECSYASRQKVKYLSECAVVKKLRAEHGQEYNPDEAAQEREKKLRKQIATLMKSCQEAEAAETAVKKALSKRRGVETMLRGQIQSLQNELVAARAKLGVDDESNDAIEDADHHTEESNTQAQVRKSLPFKVTIRDADAEDQFGEQKTLEHWGVDALNYLHTHSR
eukprot:gnl/MRDRNA2_/MRDRNA2_31666_c0_seq1.p1 gnl/MRDRNA2_/MRDRNA2_31666_c0~~gnl/MRDRNA2_/MRDRNA2_31666_c0_seq1.p1  ORF type:complete len:791 (-),score=207.72 gnl/MRDRNA2_/MRDRNA2_31666_c0_seq1:15-2387(-)